MNSASPTTSGFLARLGVEPLPPLTSPFDPGYDPLTLSGHLEQSAPLMESLKVSMACWIVAKEHATRAKIAAARRFGIAPVTGGGPFEISVAQGELEAYLDLCAALGFARIECGAGFTDMTLRPRSVASLIRERGMEMQFELGKKHTGAFTRATVEELLGQGEEWMAAGAVRLVVEARESAKGVGLFDNEGRFDEGLADLFANRFGLDVLLFEAPNKPSQFALLDHFGREVRLCNVRLEELLRVEIYRRGLHSDAFLRPQLRPRAPESRVPTEELLNG